MRVDCAVRVNLSARVGEACVCVLSLCNAVHDAISPFHRAGPSGARGGGERNEKTEVASRGDPRIDRIILLLHLSRPWSAKLYFYFYTLPRPSAVATI